MKVFKIIITVFLIGFHSLVSADEIKLGKYFIIDIEDKDYTYQSFPDLEIQNNTIAFWNGEDIQAIIHFIGHDKFEKPFSEYFKVFINDMKKGAKNIKFNEMADIKSYGGLIIKSFYATFEESGKPVNALYYFYPTNEGFQIVVCVVIDIENIKEVTERMNAVMRTTKIN